MCALRVSFIYSPAGNNCENRTVLPLPPFIAVKPRPHTNERRTARCVRNGLHYEHSIGQSLPIGSALHITMDFSIRIRIGVKVKFSWSRRPAVFCVGLPSGTQDQIFLLCLTVVGFLMLGTLSDERLGLQFTRTIASGPCQSSHCRVPVLQNSRPYFTENQVPVFISPRNRVAEIYPRALGSLFVALYDSQGCGAGILTRACQLHSLNVNVCYISIAQLRPIK
jgi:hypothetical protein